MCSYYPFSALIKNFLAFLISKYIFFSTPFVLPLLFHVDIFSWNCPWNYHVKTSAKHELWCFVREIIMFTLKRNRICPGLQNLSTTKSFSSWPFRCKVSRPENCIAWHRFIVVFEHHVHRARDRWTLNYRTCRSCLWAFGERGVVKRQKWDSLTRLL